MHLQADLLVDELKHMVPELRIAGGSFAHWLPPDPRDVPPTDRQVVRLATQRDATGKCLTDLVAGVGLAAVEPRRLASGARKWPAGYTGSVSHKGTTVVAAIASTDRMTSIGIDVEQRDAKGVPAIHGLNAAELPWSVSGADGRAILFSIKEAAYKALHPILRRPLDFSDITGLRCKESTSVLSRSNKTKRLITVARTCLTMPLGQPVWKPIRQG